jgi:hypothetical protein
VLLPTNSGWGSSSRNLQLHITGGRRKRTFHPEINNGSERSATKKPYSTSEKK